jgi:hypothetical protein
MGISGVDQRRNPRGEEDIVSRTRKLTLKLLRDMINQKKLKGGLDSRTAACKTCVDLLAMVRMNTGREWTRGNRSCDDFVSEQRKLAGDVRLGPGVRADACRRLVVLGGWAGIDILGDDPADAYAKTLLKGTTIVNVPNAPREQSKPSALVDASMLDFSGFGNRRS